MVSPSAERIVTPDRIGKIDTVHSRAATARAVGAGIVTAREMGPRGSTDLGKK